MVLGDESGGNKVHFGSARTMGDEEEKDEEPERRGSLLPKAPMPYDHNDYYKKMGIRGEED